MVWGEVDQMPARFASPCDSIRLAVLPLQILRNCNPRQTGQQRKRHGSGKATWARVAVVLTGSGWARWFLA